MTKTPLKVYLNREGVTQRSLAEILNLTQGAISHMALSDRSIFVIESVVVELIEEKNLAAAPAQ